jgi:hypothetical protein
MLAEAMERWRRDPVTFAWEVLGIWCWRKQRQMLRMMCFNRRVAIRSAQKCSKTNTVVIFALWWLNTKPGAKVLVTSSTYDNIKGVFWAELKQVVRQARCPLGLHVPDDPATGIHLWDGRFLKGFSPASQEGWGGFSGPSMCFIIDEASGIDQPMFEAMAGNLAGGGSLVMIGNPIQNDGPFFDAFHAMRGAWVSMYMSGWDTPNCTRERVQIRDHRTGEFAWATAIPGLAQPDEMAKDAEIFGTTHSFYVTRRLGDFASESDNSIVPLGLVEKARARWLIPEGQPGYVTGVGRLVIGIDPARFGTDAIAMATRRGRRVYRLQAIQGAKIRGQAGQDANPTFALTQHVVARVREEIEFYNARQRPDERRALVNIDAGGGYGAGIADMLRQLRWSKGKLLEGQLMCDVVEVNSSEVADDEDNLYNMRTQLLFGVKEWLESAPAALPCAVTGPAQVEYDMLMVDLIATRYGHDNRARKKAESKDEVRKRLGRSPDRGDALALCLYMGGTVQTDARSTVLAYGRHDSLELTSPGGQRSVVIASPRS